MSGDKKEKLNGKLADFLAGEIVEDFEFVRIFRISKKTSYRWRETGKIGYMCIGKKIYYTKSDVDMLLEKYYREAG